MVFTLKEWCLVIYITVYLSLPYFIFLFIDSNAQQITADIPPNSGRKILRLLTWNIEGLNERLVFERSMAVCDEIESRVADVVYLLEIILKTSYAITNMQTRIQVLFLSPWETTSLFPHSHGQKRFSSHTRKWCSSDEILQYITRPFTATPSS